MLSVVVRSYLEVGPTAKRTAVLAVMAPLYRRVLSFSMQTRILNEAKGTMAGEPGAKLANLPAVMAAYQEKGWGFELYTEDSAELQRRLVVIAKAEYKENYKALPECERPAFDEQAALPPLDQDATYVAGWCLSPPGVAVMHEACHKFSSSDFAHCTTKSLPGVIGSRYALDANHSLTGLVHVRVLGNEDGDAFPPGSFRVIYLRGVIYLCGVCVLLPFTEHRWRRLNKATCKFIPNFDIPAQRDAHDGDKGAATAHDDTFSYAQPSLDYLHRLDYIKGRSKTRDGGGKAGAACYVEAFHAKSLSELVQKRS